jgi:hypothetical protein
MKKFILFLLALLPLSGAAQPLPDFPEVIQPGKTLLDRPRPELPITGAILFRGPLIPPNHTLVYEQDFATSDSLGDFVMSDPAAWRLAVEEGGLVLEQFRQSEYEPSVRSPVNIALLADRKFGDFVLEADLLSTSREYGHRDLCLFFGFVSPNQFYYAHLSSEADDRAHNIFLVNKKPREKIGEALTPGVPWGTDQWHRVRVERSIADGSIKVFFNDLEKPVMTAQDRTFGFGYIGFGSFDDTGKFDAIRIWAPEVREQKTGFFRPPERAGN